MTADFKLTIGVLRRGQVLVTLTLLKVSSIPKMEMEFFYRNRTLSVLMWLFLILNSPGNV